MKDIIEKIDELFRYRKFPELLEMVGEDYNQSTLIIKLKELQLTIYLLDHYLETHWDIDEEELEEHWVAIRQALNDCMASDKDAEPYLSHIKKYQKHERELRVNKLPTRFKMSYFYFYKSCDVKLMRRLIYDHFSRLNTLIPQTLWRNFDYVTEVNDDVEDMYEDQLTINANAFLIQILNEGHQSAEKVFTHFLNEVYQANEQEKNEDIKDLTLQVYNDTVSLLNDRIKDVNKNGIPNKIRLEEFLILRK